MQQCLVEKLLASLISKYFCSNPEILWKKTKNHSGISKEHYDKYFEGRDNGFAIEIGEVIKYDEPLTLKEFNENIKAPPQSFSILNSPHKKYL